MVNGQYLEVRGSEIVKADDWLPPEGVEQLIRDYKTIVLGHNYTVELSLITPTPSTMTTVTGPPNIPFYVRQIPESNLTCKRVMDNDQKYIGEKVLIPMNDMLNDTNIPTDCASIRSRHYFPMQARNPEEANYPFAVTKNVFKV